MGGSQVYLKEGETFSLDDMMKAMVVHSANDATYAVAEYIAGSPEAFVQMMNERAHQLGMRDTKYYSVHGLPPGPGQQADVSSAYDSALLAGELVKYPDVLRWSGIDSAPFRNGSFTLRNTNHLVRTMPGCDGLKTGFYAKAGFNVVATAKRNGLRLVAVVMGSPRKGLNFHEAEGDALAGLPRLLDVSGGQEGHAHRASGGGQRRRSPRVKASLGGRRFYFCEARRREECDQGQLRLAAFG
jgi:D-alanyl-D-alanine carboxypeptidase (penicillin-binding protein 5/6)